VAILLERRVRGRSSRAGSPGGPDRRRADRFAASGDCIEIALINNMPDGALEATERQFLGLLQSAASDRLVRLRFFSLPELPRSELGRRRLETHYADIGELWNSGVDALIVTGAEPRAPTLREEPYWRTLAQVCDWAEDNTVASLWSCLAAHAAVLHLDGVERRPLGQKCSGVFDCARVSDHPVMRLTPPRLRVPHSRGNGLDEAELAARGYEVLTRSPAIGVDAFLRQRRSLFLFFQGHPEYDADTLLREYRRDVGRFLRGDREIYPEMPQGCFDAQAAAAFAAFRERAERTRDAALSEAFPVPEIENELSEAWQVPAAWICRNWLAHIAAGNRDQRALVHAAS
jgi:homoserine O-succinyltransferase